MIRKEIGYVFIKEMEAVCPIIISTDRIFLFVATGPGHSDFLQRTEMIRQALNDSKFVGKWNWLFLSEPIPGIYVALHFPHKHRESPIDFLRHATGFAIKEKDEHPHLHLFHD